MKFNLNDFMQLDTKALLAVNGGTSCGGSSGGSSGGGSYSRNHSSWSNGGGSNRGSSGGGSYGGSGGGSCSGSSSGGNCGGAASSTVASGGGVCGGSNNTNTSSSNNRPGYQTPDNPNDYHCDINSYNVAVNEGIHNPGNWNGNALSVNEIYNENYTNSSTDRPQAGTRGYGFYDNNGDGTYDHMYFYDYTKGGSSYHVWNSDGIQPVTESDWSINGTAVEHSVYVPLN